jgi:hypothetical protein
MNDGNTGRVIESEMLIRYFIRGATMSRLILIVIGACLVICSAALGEPEACWVPEFVTCPGTIRVYHCDSTLYQFQAVNPITMTPDPSIRYHIVYGAGHIDTRTGIWSLNPQADTAELHQPFVEIAASNGQIWTTGSQNCRFQLMILGSAPFISLERVEPGDTIDIRADTPMQIPITYGDSDPCESPLLSIQPTGLEEFVYISYDQGAQLNLNFTPEFNGAIIRISVIVTSFGTAVPFRFYARVQAPVSPPIGVQIEKLHNVIQGQYADVDITLEICPVVIGGFFFLLGFDNSALTLANVTIGSALGPTGCAWEYFGYRFEVAPGCTDACPSGRIKVAGIADVNAPGHPLCFTPPSFPATLFTLNFLVSNDRMLECSFLPIRFYWTDCSDNVLSRDDGQVFYNSQTVADFTDPVRDISDPNVGFPTYLGAQNSCDNPTPPSSPVPVRAIAFIDGGLDLVCDYPIDISGDLNLNGLQYEAADYDLFRQYFLKGLSVFTINVNGQIATSDVNHDGNTLSLTDLVSLNRVIRGEIVPPVDPPAIALGYTMIASVPETGLTLIASPDSLGAVLLVYDAPVALGIVSTDMEVMTQTSATQTRVLIAPPPGQSAFLTSGYSLSTWPPANLIFAQAATVRGDSVNVIYGSITDMPTDPSSLPTEFALHPNYPNPFNASTVISFDLPRAEQVTLDIVNLLGQRVFTHAAQYGQGTHNFTWDGSDNNGHTVASGVYYFRLSAGDFSATQKMMLLK